MIFLFQPLAVQAAALTTRSITLGTSKASAVTTHQFSFTTATTASIGSIGFLYCTTASGTCTTPTGLSTTSATLDAQSGATGFTINNTTQGAPFITRTAASIASGTALSYTLGSITNPSTTTTSYYVRITTYTGTDGATGATDTGLVIASVAAEITVNTTINQVLTFCIYTGANCGAGGTTVNLGTLTSTSTGNGVSKMDAATNGSGGYVIQYNGPTLTSGSDIIAAIGAVATTLTQGTEQFGINATGVNSAVTGSAAPSGGSGTASANYNTVDNYAFVASTTTQIASASGPTNSTTFTVSYVADVNGATPLGTYTTTITYVCTATF